MKRKFRLVTALFLFAGMLGLVSACKSKTSENTQPPSTKKPTAAHTEPVPPQTPFDVKFETTAGDFTVKVHPKWAPLAAKRFRELVEDHFFDGDRFFRVVQGFVVQWGMNGDPTVESRWQGNTFADEPVLHGNKPGTITFAKTSQPNSRTTQVFINLGDNSKLDSKGFAAFGEVVDGMKNVRRISSKYGQTPDQNMIGQRGNEYLDRYFPDLDHIKKAYVVK